MTAYDFSLKTTFEPTGFQDRPQESGALFILCKNHEVPVLRDVFGFDESTVLDCTDLDESVRYTSFDGYDFISMVHLELLEDDFVLREINLYISSRYLVFVIPEHNSPRLSEMEKKLLAHAKVLEERNDGHINGMYFAVLHNLLTDFSDTLEILEDRMQDLTEKIVDNVNEEQFARINNLRKMSYTAKKQLRALSYLGEQILLDENRLIDKNQAHYFRNINTRFKKLYDFSESLYNLCSEMLYTYDSRLTMKTNDTVNKLTVLTLFFGPLTVITGIYGMNFDLMPELKWPFGYPLALGTMAVVSLILFFVLKRKRWL